MSKVTQKGVSTILWQQHIVSCKKNRVQLHLVYIIQIIMLIASHLIYLLIDNLTGVKLRDVNAHGVVNTRWRLSYNSTSLFICQVFSFASPFFISFHKFFPCNYYHLIFADIGSVLPVYLPIPLLFHSPSFFFFCSPGAVHMRLLWRAAVSHTVGNSQPIVCFAAV